MRSACLDQVEGRSRPSANMWKILTRKFKAHSLEDIPPLRSQDTDDRDSGTESDNENAELEAIEEAIQCNWDDDHYDPVLSPVDIRTLSTTLRSHKNGLFSPPSALSHPQKSSFKRAIQTYPDLQALSRDVTWHRNLDRRSPAARCQRFNGYEVSGADLTDDLSSEEELSVINCSLDDDEPDDVDDDDEEDDGNRSAAGAHLELHTPSESGYEPKPLKFISSPPKGVHKLRHILSPALFLARLSSNKVGFYSFTHRKRLKQTQSRDVSDALRIERPCLDFEKMRVEFCL